MYVIIEIVYFFLVLPMKSLHVKFCYGSGKKYQWCQNPLGEMLGNGKVRESQRECKMLQLARKMEREEWGEAAKDRNLGKIYAYIEGIKENQDGKEIRRKQYYRCQEKKWPMVLKASWNSVKWRLRKSQETCESKRLLVTWWGSKWVE